MDIITINNENYEMYNAEILSVDLGFHEWYSNMFIFSMFFKYDSSDRIFQGTPEISIGNYDENNIDPYYIQPYYLEKDEVTIEKINEFYARSFHFIQDIIKTVGVSNWDELVGSHVRLLVKDDKIIYIGNIMEDKWLNIIDIYAIEKLKYRKNFNKEV